MEPQKNLNASIRGLSQLFYPTHNIGKRSIFEYYHQREWKIISDILVRGKPTTRTLTEAEQQNLIDCNKPYFSKVIELIDGSSKPRVEACLVYMPPNGTCMELAKKIWVPKESIAAAKKLVEKYKLNIPISSC